MNNEDCTIKRCLVTSQSEPILLLPPYKEDTDGSYEFSQRSPITPSSHCDLEDTLTSLLDGGTSSNSQQKRNDFLLHAITSTPNNNEYSRGHGGGTHGGGGDSGIDPGFWVRSVPSQSSHKNPVEFSPDHKTGLRLEKTNSPLVNGSCHYRETSDSSEISFHLPSPSYAWAPPPSPEFQHKSSFSFPSSCSSKKSSVTDSPSFWKTNSAPTDEVGVARHLSDSSQSLPSLLLLNHTSYHSTPNLQRV